MKDFKTLFRLEIQKCFKNKEIIRFERIYIISVIHIYIYIFPIQIRNIFFLSIYLFSINNCVFMNFFNLFLFLY